MSLSIITIRFVSFGHSQKILWGMLCYAYPFWKKTPMITYLMIVEIPEAQSNFERIYLHHKGLIYHTAYKILNNEDDAKTQIIILYTPSSPLNNY